MNPLHKAPIVAGFRHVGDNTLTVARVVSGLL
jgi:hypothetical protein